MKRIYFCPACGATLNPGVKVILSAHKAGTRGLILLSPQPGNYEVIPADELDLHAGDRIALHCPVCQQDLASQVNENLTEIGFRMSNGTEGRVNFSRRYGERATFFITTEDVRTYGEDADAYGGLNFFGAGEPEKPGDA